MAQVWGRKETWGLSCAMILKTNRSMFGWPDILFNGSCKRLPIETPLCALVGLARLGVSRLFHGPQPALLNQLVELMGMSVLQMIDNRFGCCVINHYFHMLLNLLSDLGAHHVVCYTAVFSFITQRYSLWGEALMTSRLHTTQQELPNNLWAL